MFSRDKKDTQVPKIFLNTLNSFEVPFFRPRYKNLYQTFHLTLTHSNTDSWTFVSQSTIHRTVSQLEGLFAFASACILKNIAFAGL